MWAAGGETRIKPSARIAIELLQDLHIEPVMMTGDSEPTAKAVAAELRLDRVFTDSLSDDGSAATPTCAAVRCGEATRAGVA